MSLPLYLAHSSRMPAAANQPQAARTHSKEDEDFRWRPDFADMGLPIVFAVSFAYVCIYHFIVLAGPFAFFAWWLTAHSEDWQNASVPMTVVLGALSLFWASAGILTGTRDD